MSITCAQTQKPGLFHLSDRSARSKRHCRAVAGIIAGPECGDAGQLGVENPNRSYSRRCEHNRFGLKYHEFASSSIHSRGAYYLSPLDALLVEQAGAHDPIVDFDP